MTPEVERFVILAVLGLSMLALEVFIPGGVVGMIGGFLLLCAMIAGFIAFGAEGGWMASAVMILIGGAGLVAWIKLFPRTPMGKRLILSRAGTDFKTVPESIAPALLHQTGTAQTDLRPGGVALINGRRVDVVSQSGYLPVGTSLHVVAVEGPRVVVRKSAAT